MLNTHCAVATDDRGVIVCDPNPRTARARLERRTEDHIGQPHPASREMPHSLR
jgi:hypothetical protein